MIDIHSHILTGIDDGVDTIETSIELLKVVQADGVKTILQYHIIIADIRKMNMNSKMYNIYLF